MTSKHGGKVLRWYIVIWRNKDFFRTSYRPNKVGTIIGMEDKPDENARSGLHLRKRRFETVERYLPLMTGTARELDIFLTTGARSTINRRK